MIHFSKQLYNKFMAVSVPPKTNPSLSKGFRQLARIHYYLGREPIDFMLEDVKKATPQEIEKGTIPLLFAVKEMQDFLFKMRPEVVPREQNNPALYFEKTFQETLDTARTIFQEVYKSPTEKNNQQKIAILIQLVLEVEEIYTILHQQGVSFSTDYSGDITKAKATFLSLKGLGNAYPNLSKLNDLSYYQTEAKKSILNQIQTPFNFKYQEFKKIYTQTDGDWAYTLQTVSEKQKDIDAPGYPFNETEAIALKETFLTQMNGANRLIQNGALNHLLFYLTSIDIEKDWFVGKSQEPSQAQYNQEIASLKRLIKNRFNPEKHTQELRDFEENKETYLARKDAEKQSFEAILINLHDQEQHIQSLLGKINHSLLQTPEQQSPSVILERTTAGPSKSPIIQGMNIRIRC